MRVAEFNSVKEAKRTTQGQFEHYYAVMGAANVKTAPVPQKKPAPSKPSKK